MGQDKRTIKKIQEYYELSSDYLESAKISYKNELFEPAMFTAIRALELALKGAVLTKTKDALETYNIGVQFEKYFREELGNETCKGINVLLSKYNLSRYPDDAALDPVEVKKNIKYIEDFIEHMTSKFLLVLRRHFRLQ